jgi:hypothetical protein
VYERDEYAYIMLSAAGEAASTRTGLGHQTETSLSRRSDTIRLAASLPTLGAAGVASNDTAAGGELIALTPLAMPGAAT